MKKNKLVSVIIPTYNEEKNITRLLKSLQNQVYSHIEVIVVDDGSQDETFSIAKENGAVVFQRGHRERSVQRNFGAKKAKGNYFLFLDADMELGKDVIAKSIILFDKDSKVGAIVIPEESVATNFWEEVKAFERSFYNENGDMITDAARFFTKDAFYKAGGYDETITGPEDWDLPETVSKKGYKIGRVKEKIFHHEKIASPFSVAKKKYYYGLKAHRYLKKQNISFLGAKTVYFLRPVFYKKIHKFIEKPLLSLGMIFMLSLELIFGGFGVLVGKLKNI